MERKYPNHVFRILRVALEGFILFFTFLVNAFYHLISFHKIMFLEVSVKLFFFQKTCTFYLDFVLFSQFHKMLVRIANRDDPDQSRSGSALFV